MLFLTPNTDCLDKENRENNMKLNFNSKSTSNFFNTRFQFYANDNIYLNSSDKCFYLKYECQIQI